MSLPPRALAAVALLITVLSWASAFVAIRSVGEHISPAPMALGRLAVGGLALAVVLTRRGFRCPRGRALVIVAANGVLWFALYTVLVNAAERHLDAGTTAMLVNIAPIVVAVTAGLVLKEGFPPLLFAGIVVSFAGVTILALGGGGRHDLLSMAMVVVAALLYGFATVGQKVALRDTDPLTMTAMGAIIGAVVLLPWSGQLVSELSTTPTAAAGIVYLGLVPTALAFVTFAYALQHTSAGLTASSTYAVPAITVLLSWALLGETPTTYAIIGGIICLAGVAISRVHPRRRRVTSTVLVDDSAPAARPAAALGGPAQPPAHPQRQTHP